MLLNFPRLCNTEGRALVKMDDSVAHKSNLDHAARNPSEIKKIVPGDEFCHLPEYFESILDDEVWIKIKFDHQIAAQFVACRKNHESSILPNFFHAPACLSIQK